MKTIFALFAFIACAAAFPSYPHVSTKLYQVPINIQKTISVPEVVQTGVSHHPFHVPESRFTRTDWATPGHVYAVPAVRQYTVTKPGYTTLHEGAPIVHKSYVPTSVPVQTVTAHKTYSVVQPVAVKSVAVAAAPVIGHGLGYDGGYAGGYGAGYGGYGAGIHGGY
ncbi:uncharacterized protein LOC141858645 [Brevipalpus obovatus]|uniref:uncharacterized protein LOC141858645 n=1 Tax=Brevipalpus obovatus TaxID=246614 RepID=UPI003D9E6BDE